MVRRLRHAVGFAIFGIAGCSAGSTPAEAGWVEWNGERYALPNVLALQRDSDVPMDFSGVAPEAHSVVWIVMTEKPIAAARASEEQVPRRLLDADSGRGIAVRLGGGGVFLNPVYVYAGSAAKPEHRSQSGGGGYAEVAVLDGARIAGRLVKESNGGPVHWNLPFDAPIQQSDPVALARWGTPLPAGGGEVGAALERDNAAKRSGDLATILRFGSADFPGLAEADADTKKQMLDAMRESSLLPDRVLGGLQRGDQAVVIDLIDAPEAPRRDDIVCVRRFERKSGDWHQAARNCVSA